MNSLEHHGIKGQKWGVRRFQNKDGTRTEAYRMRLKGAKRKQQLIKSQLGYDVDQKKFLVPDPNSSKAVNKVSGETVNHVTPVDFKALRPDQDLYVSATEYDKNLYRSMLTMQMRKKGFGADTPIKEVTFKLKEDLHSPSNEEQRKIFQDVYSKHKSVFDGDIASYYAKEPPNSKDTYDMFIKSLDKSGESKRLFYQAMQKSGYNAVLDQHDITDSWMQASRPLIVMNALNTLGDMKVKNISNKQIEEALRRLNYI